jgi:hypothetical protein
VPFGNLNNSNSRKQIADAAIGSFQTSEYVLAGSYTFTTASQEAERQGNASARHSLGFLCSWPFVTLKLYVLATEAKTGCA